MQFIKAQILAANLFLSTVIFAVVAAICVMPRMTAMSPASLFVPILLLHAFRHLGLMFLAEGAVLGGMPRAFALPAAWGDLVTAALALVALHPVIIGSSAAVPMMWIFNLIGTIDLVLAIAQAVRHRAAAFMGAAYWIPAFWVPALLVTHGLVFIKLLS